jgi:hypothetical protein
VRSLYPLKRADTRGKFSFMSLRIRPPLIRGLVWLAGMGMLFAGYTSGLSVNPPGFYLDESAIAYNAYLIGHTGAGEFEPRLPLFFQFYTGRFIEYANPTQIYLLSVPFLVTRPGILKARVFGAAWVFAACLVLGFLAKQISGRRRIGS